MTEVNVITGGTGGMGIAIAQGFEKNDCILLADMSEDRLNAVQRQLEQEGFTDVHTAICNVTEKESVQALAERCKELGQLGSLIHTAGVSPASFDARTILDVNLCGTVLIVDAFESLIQEGSVAVCIASMSGHIAQNIPQLAPIFANPIAPFFMDAVLTAIQNNAQAAYPLSKKAVIALVEKRGVVWGEKGGRIVSVSPGLIMTPMGEKEAENEETSKQMKDMNPLGRFGDPVEIANVVHFLISKQASYINGTDLRVDGGVTPVLREIVNK